MPKERNKADGYREKATNQQQTIAKNMGTNGTNFIYSKTKLI